MNFEHCKGLGEPQELVGHLQPTRRRAGSVLKNIAEISAAKLKPRPLGRLAMRTGRVAHYRSNGIGPCADDSQKAQAGDA